MGPSKMRGPIRPDPHPIFFAPKTTKEEHPSNAQREAEKQLRLEVCIRQLFCFTALLSDKEKVYMVIIYNYYLYFIALQT